MSALDDQIAALHVRMDRADEACHEGEAAWYRFEIHRLEDLRDSAEWCAHRRQLERDLAFANYSGDADAADVARAAIDRWERGRR